MLGRLFIPIPFGSVVGSKESALLVLPFLRELGCPLLVRAHQQPRGIRGIHVRGEKRAVIVEIRQGVIVAAGKSQAKLIMPIHYISNARKTVRLCKYSSAEKSSHSSEVWNASSWFRGSICFATSRVLQLISWSFWPRERSGQAKSPCRHLELFVDSTDARNE